MQDDFAGTIDSTVVADDPKQSRDSGSGSPPPERGQDRANLSIEEKGMLVMPVTPSPQGHVDVGGLPSSEGSGGGEGSSGGGSEGGGQSSPSDSGE